jgi:hypothetical protein
LSVVLCGLFFGSQGLLFLVDLFDKFLNFFLFCSEQLVLIIQLDSFFYYRITPKMNGIFWFLGGLIDCTGLLKARYLSGVCLRLF